MKLYHESNTGIAIIMVCFRPKVAYAVNQVDGVLDTVDHRITSDVEFLARSVGLELGLGLGVRG